ncbi:MAG: hypothetical protein R3C11_12595 [Planctomycetaceae bacterium]
MIFRRVRIWPSLILCWGLLLFNSFHPAPLPAAEQTLQFLEGLRERNYFDTALFYIDQQRKRSDLPPDLAAHLEYERAALLLESSSLIRNPESRQQRLNEAAQALTDFVTAHPDHAQVGSANRELAKVHLNNARVSSGKPIQPTMPGKDGAASVCP